MPDGRIGAQRLIGHEKDVLRTRLGRIERAVGRKPDRQPVVQRHRIASGPAVEQEGPVGRAEFMVAQPGHVVLGEGVRVKEPLVLRQQAFGMVQRTTEGNKEHGIRHRGGKGWQPQDIVVVLRDIAPRPGASHHKPHQVAVTVDLVLFGRIGGQPVRGDIGPAIEDAPVDLVQRLGALGVDLDPVAMGALGPDTGLLPLATDPRPEVRRQNKGHVGIGERAEGPGAMDFPHQDRRSGAGKAGDEDMAPVILG